MRADQLLDDGDMAGAETWHRILDAIAVRAMTETYNIPKGTMRRDDSACVWFTRKQAVIMASLCVPGRDEFLTPNALAHALWGAPDRWPRGWHLTVVCYVSTIRKAMRGAGLQTQIRNRQQWGYHLEPFPQVELPQVAKTAGLPDAPKRPL